MYFGLSAGEASLIPQETDPIEYFEAKTSLDFCILHDKILDWKKLIRIIKKG